MCQVLPTTVEVSKMCSQHHHIRTFHIVFLEIRSVMPELYLGPLCFTAELYPVGRRARGRRSAGSDLLMVDTQLVVRYAPSPSPACAKASRNNDHNDIVINVSEWCSDGILWWVYTYKHHSSLIKVFWGNAPFLNWVTTPQLQWLASLLSQISCTMEYMQAVNMV